MKNHAGRINRNTKTEPASLRADYLTQEAQQITAIIERLAQHALTHARSRK